MPLIRKELAMRVLFKSLKFFLCFFTFLQLLKASIEEGWRYQDTFKLSVTNDSVTTQIGEDFLKNIHAPMAYTVDIAKKVYEKTDLPSPAGRIFAAFRFTPIMQENTDSHFFPGRTVSISNTAIEEGFPAEVQFSTGYECVFVSGFFKVGEDKTKLTSEIIMYDAYYENIAVKPEVFVRIPPLTIAALPYTHIPYTFLMRNYIDPEHFTRSLMFRYLGNITGSILEQGDYSRIRAVHAETEQALEKRKRKIEDAFYAAKELAGTTDISILLKPINELKSDRRKIGNNVRANSYSCAEQVGLDFISDTRIIDYLRKGTRVADEKVVGVIVHVHTSETPCGGACTTSLARECEAGGLFSRIFQGKPVKLISTASKHYERPDGQIRYDDTRYKEALRPFNVEPAPIEFSLTNVTAAYPIILYGEEMPGDYKILRDRYSMRPN